MSFTVECTLQEINLAWKRTLRDKLGRCFTTHPYHVRWVSSYSEEWLKALSEKLVSGYSPDTAQLCMVPKPNYLARPALILQLQDEVVYALLVGKLFKTIHPKLLPLQGLVDISYKLSENVNDQNWVQSDFSIWRQWREKSLQAINENVSHVIVADIAGFYDNIDLERLKRLLNGWGADKNILNALFECINRWVYPRSKGIPQGYAASDVLAKAYLLQIDEAMRAESLVHLRYVDDIRMFCSSHTEGQRQLRRLIELYHNHGLTMQSSKTEIIEAEIARTRFDGIIPFIQKVKEQLVSQGELLIPPISMSPDQEEEELDQLPLHDQTVLEKAFVEKFIISPVFDKTLFHYLLNQLGRIKSHIAVPYSLNLIKSRLEETDFILTYLGRLELSETHLEPIVDHLVSTNATSDYQLFQILRWFLQLKYSSPRIMTFCREFAFDRNKPQWLRSTAVAYLGLYASGSDFTKLQEEYSKATTDIERADIVHALRTLEKGQRNAFYGRVKDDSCLVQTVISSVKNEN